MLNSVLRPFSASAGSVGSWARAVGLQKISHVSKVIRPLSTMAGVTLEERGTPNSDDYRIYYRK